MDKILIIAEKPSVAGDIARVLGKMTKNKDYHEGEKYIVSSAVGHLLEMIPPPGVDVPRGKWSLVNLPVLPETFDLQPIKASESRLRTLVKLYARPDVISVINACDAGREGELIFFNLMRYLSEKKPRKKAISKPVQRLWLQSMTPTAIRNGFERLRDNEEFIPLQRAAVSRAEADWMVGINSTRAMTALHSAAGGFLLTTIGRVQTPTLALLAERDAQISAFISRPYWEVRADFVTNAGGIYEGIWHNTGAAAKTKPERIFAKEQAEKVLQECAIGKIGDVTEIVKPTKESPPMLFDLTTLQREANSRFGFSAKGTLSTAQALYERHKLITYPRTDSRCLPEDYPATVRKTLAALSDSPMVGEHAKRVLDENWVVPANKRIFNNAKVSDHFAIVPTGEIKQGVLRDNERKLYDFITSRFVAVFFPPSQFVLTERKTQVGKDHCFVSKGRIMKDLGWRVVASSEVKDVEIPSVEATAGGKPQVKVEGIQSEEKVTTPQPHYNEATLLSAMERAGNLLEDEELREAMRDRGLGTPATRSSVIEGLLRERYLMRDRRDLLTTPKAHSLMRLLSALKIDVLTKPSLTGDWEHKLRCIEKENADHRLFMEEIRKMTKVIVDAAKNCGDVENIEGDFATLTAPCPACGGQVKEKHRRFACSKCEFFIWKAICAREFSIVEMETLLKDGALAELEGFRSRLGREFSAKLLLKQNEEGNWQAAFDFDNGATEAAGLDATTLAEKEIIADCPKCGAKVREIDSRYLCERGAGEAPSCDFSITKRILQQEISTEQVRLLLTDGKTAVMENFISKKTQRPFKAQLAMDLTDKTGKLSFEFAPRAAKKRATKK